MSSTWASSSSAAVAGTDVSDITRPVVGGDTVVGARAMASVARAAAGEVEGVELVTRSGLARFLADLLPGSGGNGVSAEMGRASTALSLHLSVSWPSPVGRVADAARRHVQARVSDLTGYTVTEVDIVVDSLPAPGTARTRRVS